MIMKTGYRAIAVAVVALSSLSLVIGAYAENASADRSETSSTTADLQNGVTKANKASGLIGMEVRNPQNEKLGDIKDVMLDLRSSKIGYVVMAVGGFLGVGDKYIAVPSAAFTPSADRDTLVLNADKAKIQNAPGFAKADWPDLNQPSIAAAASYWGSAESVKVREPLRQGTGSTGGGALSGTGGDAEQVFSGRVTALDSDAKTISVKGATGTLEFKFAERPVVILKNNRTATTRDLKAGHTVVVNYHQDNGAYVADTVTQSDTPEVK